MKTTNRVRLNRNLKTPAPQAGIKLANPIPESVAQEVRDALDNFQRAGAAAALLCMMNGDSLHESIRAFQPKDREARYWNKFCNLNIGFESGVSKLAFDQVQRFGESLEAWRDGQIEMLSGRRPSLNSRLDIENEVAALSYLIHLLGNIQSYYNYEKDDAGAYFCGQPVIASLRAAWGDSFALSQKMHDIFQSNQRPEELKHAA
ncbi:MAG TPA: hypothetical protein VGI03_07085 [Verrucomicrobiae bacterium]|jgi:hypothetical protein